MTQQHATLKDWWPDYCQPMEGLDPVAKVRIYKGSTTGKDNLPRFVAIVWHGNKKKPALYQAYRTEEDMNQSLDSWYQYKLKTAQEIAERKSKEKAMRSKPLGINVGDIFYHSWGYEQTNIDFYEVIRIVGKRVVFRKLLQETTETGFMCGPTVPLPGTDGGKIMTKSPRWCWSNYTNDAYLDVSMEYGFMGPWDGKPKECSWYG